MVTEQIQTTETGKLSREEIIERLKIADRCYRFNGDEISFEVGDTHKGRGKSSIQYHLGRFKDNKLEIQFDSQNPSQIIYVGILYNKLRKMGVNDVLNVPVTEDEVSHIKSSAETLERIANVLEFQIREMNIQKNGNRR